VKLLRSALILSSLFSLSLMAGQRGGGGGFRGGGGGGFRGGGGYAAGGFRGGYGGFRGYGFGYGYGLGFGFGYGYPYYYGGYYAPYYADPYYYAAPAYPAYAPAVTYAAPAATYAAPAAPAAAATTYYRPADFYLIAFTDHNIRAVQSFQVVGDQIEFTPREGGAVQSAPLASVDRRFSEQINRDRRVKFALP
jgi:hypothetical protein